MHDCSPLFPRHQLRLDRGLRPPPLSHMRITTTEDPRGGLTCQGTGAIIPGNAESVELTSNYDQWRSAQDSLLQDFDRLHPGRVWLRSWHTVDFPISRSHCPTVLWYDFLPSRFTTPPFGQMLKRDRYSRPPIKFRYVICHYGQPFSWHWFEAAPTSDRSNALLSATWSGDRMARNGAVHYCRVQPRPFNRRGPQFQY